jgi:hypothetical protein
MSIKAMEIYKNEINNIGNHLLSFDNRAVNAKGERLKVLADKLHKEIAALKLVEGQKPSTNTRMNAIAFASSWCEKHGWNPDVIENFADALVEWQQHHA